MRGSVRCTAVMAAAGMLLVGAVATASATPGQAAGQVAGQTAGQAPGRSSGQAPEPSGGVARGDMARAGSDPVLVDCLFKPNVRPQDFMLACGDGNSRLTGLHWTHWGTDSATAVGVNVVNDCEPYCAAGTFHSYAVAVRLDQPRAWKASGTDQYSRISLTYLNDRPAGHSQVLTLPLWK